MQEKNKKLLQKSKAPYFYEASMIQNTKLSNLGATNLRHFFYSLIYLFSQA